LTTPSAQFPSNPENVSFPCSNEDCVLHVDLVDNFYQSAHDQYSSGKALSLEDVGLVQSENTRHAAAGHPHLQDAVELPQLEQDRSIPHDVDAISHYLRKDEHMCAWDGLQDVSSPGPDSVGGIHFPYQWEDILPPSGLDGGPAFKKRARARARTSVFESWLRENGLTSYPNRQQLEKLAVADGKTLKQARVALSNLRARLKLSKSFSSGKFDMVLMQIEECEDPALVAMLGSVSNSIGRYAQASHTLNFSSSPTQSHCVPPLGFGHQTAFSGGFDIWSLVSESESIATSNKSSPATCDEQLSALDLSYNPTPLEQQQEFIKRKGKRRYAARHTPHSSIAGQSGSLQGSEKMFSCTSCPESFRRAFDWQRHEEGAHKFNHIEWVCPFHDMSLVTSCCIFCSHNVESIEHFANTHNVHICSVPGDIESSSPPDSTSRRRGLHVCSGQSVSEHTFTRKDLLAQHVRGIHFRSAEHTVTNLFRVPDAWSKLVDPERTNHDALWCGFCLQSFLRIPDRMAHVADHFRDGFTIDGWVPRIVF
jgi:hypothetical protein